MAATYDESKLHLPRNRVRRDTRDTVVSPAKRARFQDEEIDSWLVDSGHRHFLWIYHDGTTGSGITGATIGITNEATDMLLTLTRVGVAETPPTFSLSARAYDTVGELILAIRALAAGWNVGLDQENTIHWMLSKPDNDIPTMYIDALNKFESRNLAEVAAATSVFGSALKERLQWLNTDRAVDLAMSTDAVGVNSFKRYKEKDVEIERFSAAEKAAGQKKTTVYGVPM